MRFCDMASVNRPARNTRLLAVISEATATSIIVKPLSFFFSTRITLSLQSATVEGFSGSRALAPRAIRGSVNASAGHGPRIGPLTGVPLPGANAADTRQSHSPEDLTISDIDGLNCRRRGHNQKSPGVELLFENSSRARFRCKRDAHCDWRSSHWSTYVCRH